MASGTRLIDANVLIEDLEAAEANAGMGAVVARTLIRYVKRCATVDAVEVIRCESCKWYEPECENCDFWGGYRNMDHYCGEGERKNEAG